MSIQMMFPNGLSGSVQLPQPSNAVITLAAGIGAVAEQDVRLAMQMGATVMTREPWPQRELLRMCPPLRAGETTSSSFNLPDGTSVTPQAGVALIRRETAQWARNNGWSDVAPVVCLVNATATQTAPCSWLGGPGLFAVTSSSTSGAVIALQYSLDGGTTWLAEPSGACSLTDPGSPSGYASFNLPACKIRVTITGGPPSSVFANAIPGNLL